MALLIFGMVLIVWGYAISPFIAVVAGLVVYVAFVLWLHGLLIGVPLVG